MTLSDNNDLPKSNLKTIEKQTDLDGIENDGRAAHRFESAHWGGNTAGHDFLHNSNPKKMFVSSNPTN